MIRARGLVKTYGHGRAARRVLDGADLDVAAGETVAVVGRSGSGKSTLLHLLGALDHAEAGEISVGGARVDGRSQRELTAFRRVRETAGGDAVLETFKLDTAPGVLPDTARELAYLDAQGGRPGANTGSRLDRNVRLYKAEPR